MAKQPLLKRIWRATPIIGVAILLTFVFSQQGLLRKFETTALDTTMRLQSKRLQNEIAVVRITDEDYKDRFHAKSPLDPDALQEIVDAIARGKPRIIGVDIDTSASAFTKLQSPPIPVPVIWARTGAYSNLRKQVHLFDYLGGNNPGGASGLVLFKVDEDGALRRYSRIVPTNMGPFPSLSWAIIKQLGADKSKNLTESEEELFINYVDSSWDSRQVNISSQEIVNLSTTEGFQTDGILKDKIVLLGGDYAVQDEHDTPLGWMIGVHALKQIIATELEGGGPRPASTMSIVLLELVDGFVLLLLFQIFRLRKAVIISVFLIPFLALVCSLLAFRSFAQWAYFVPILVLILGHQLYERVKDYFKKLPEQIADATQ